MSNRTNEELEKENTILRGLVAKLPIPCVYCGKQNMAECPSGFPGCAMADDIMCGNDEFEKRQLAKWRDMMAELDGAAFLHENDASRHWNQWARIAHEEFAKEIRNLIARYKS